MRKEAYATLLPGFVLVLFSACAFAKGWRAGEQVDDTTIANSMGAKTVEDLELSLPKINGDAFNGNVTHPGVVPGKEAEDRFMSLAGGFASVTSRLTVQVA